MAVVSPDEWEAVSAARAVAAEHEVDGMGGAAGQREPNEDAARVEVGCAIREQREGRRREGSAGEGSQDNFVDV